MLRDSGSGPPRGQSLGSAADSRDNKDLEGQRESLVAQAAAESKNTVCFLFVA